MPDGGPPELIFLVVMLPSFIIQSKEFSHFRGNPHFVCHDYAPNGRDVAWQTTVGEERLKNIHVGNGASEAEFVKCEKSVTLPGDAKPDYAVHSGEYAGRTYAGH